MNPSENHPHDPTPDSAGSASEERASPAARAQNLARELTGDLPCIACGYNLRSISVLSVCPECGTPVRATLLATVDPYASVLQPVRHPRLIAGGLLTWCLSALSAAGVVWGLRAADAIEVLAGIRVDVSRMVLVSIGLVILSGIGAAVALLRPHRGIPRWQMLVAGIAVLAHLPLAYLMWQLHMVFDPPRLRPYLEGLSPSPARATLRIFAAAAMLIIVIGLRPNFRLLTSRSLVLRMGRVDRQTMLAIAAAIGVAALGDLLHLIAAEIPPAAAETAYILGVILIALGSMLVTGGLVGLTIDSLRTVPVLLRPPVSYGQIMGSRSGDERGEGSER